MLLITEAEEFNSEISEIICKLSDTTFSLILQLRMIKQFRSIKTMFHKRSNPIVTSLIRKRKFEKVHQRIFNSYIINSSKFNLDESTRDNREPRKSP